MRLRYPAQFAYIGENLGRVVVKLTGFDFVFGVGTIWRNLILTPNLVFFVSGPIHRDLQRGIHRLLYPQHDIEHHVEVLVEGVDKVRLRSYFPLHALLTVPFSDRNFFRLQDLIRLLFKPFRHVPHRSVTGFGRGRGIFEN